MMGDDIPGRILDFGIGFWRAVKGERCACGAVWFSPCSWPFLGSRWLSCLSGRALLLVPRKPRLRLLLVGSHVWLPGVLCEAVWVLPKYPHRNHAGGNRQVPSLTTAASQVGRLPSEQLDGGFKAFSSRPKLVRKRSLMESMVSAQQTFVR